MFESGVVTGKKNIEEVLRQIPLAPTLALNVCFVAVDGMTLLIIVAVLVATATHQSEGIAI